MRAFACVLVAAIAGCHPSATVERTMPVANLQSYRTVALRVKATAYAAQGQAQILESNVLQNLQRQCGFEQFAQPGARADVMVDLNITNTARGGNGWIKNPNVATLDTLLVLSDGQTGDLLGTARIHGESSGLIINNAPPENEAIGAVAKSVADMLAKSGCSGPRIARVEPPPPAPKPVPPPKPGATPPPPVDESHRAEAEAANEQGKEMLRGADLQGAVAAFERANTLVPDARYEFNTCLALEAQQQWDGALAACHKAQGMNPQPKLAEKIDQRLELISHHQ